MIDFKSFEELSQTYNVVPIYQEVRADYETILSIFQKVKGQFLLESVENGHNAGRYSFIAKGKKIKYELKGKRLEEESFTLGEIQEKKIFNRNNPLEIIQQKFKSYKYPEIPRDFPSFSGGALGYLGYETIQYFEKIPVHLQQDFPDGILIVPELLIIMDNVKKSLFFIYNAHISNNLKKEYNYAVEILETNINLVSKNYFSKNDIFINQVHKVKKNNLFPIISDKIHSNIKKEDFIKMVEKCKKHIYQGDIIQVVLSQQFKTNCEIPPFELYRELRHINPSPYMYFLDYGDFQLIGSSPEVMVKLDRDEVLIKPIAGTRKRGCNSREDKEIATGLLNDPKELAEHLMLVDLGRNDLSRIAKPHSVKVENYQFIEYYSHVMHIVSTVKAKMDSNYDAFDLIKATFPAGTLSGAPKIKAMEIIAQTENIARSSYGGMICQFAYNGSLNSCITIRTILLSKQEAIVQAGAGIVADSVAENEYQECVNKASALLQTIEKSRNKIG